MSDENGWIPESWQEAKLDSVVLSVSYGHTASSTPEQVGPKFLRITDLQDGSVDWDAVPFCVCSDGEIDKYQLKSGDIVIARTGATTGKSYLLDNPPIPSVFASYLIRLETLKDVLPKFLATFMQSGDYWRQISSVKKGMAQPGANASVLKQLSIPIAPLNEQRRIVAKIEALQERSRKAREALSEVGPLLEQFRQSLLAAAFRGDLTADWRAENPDVEPASQLLARIRQERRERWEQAELAKYEAKGKKPPKGWNEKYQEPEPVDDSELPELPEGWCWVVAEEIVDADADIRYGIVQPGPPLENGVPYVRGVDIQNGEILVDQLWNTSNAIAEKYQNSMIKAGDVLLGIIRHLKVAIVPESLDGANMARTTARLRPSKGITTEYLAEVLKSPWCQGWLKAHYRGGTSMPKVNIADACRLPIPLPSLREQGAICEALSRGLAPMSMVSNLVDEALRETDSLDKATLAKAFRGELVPQDPNDEPASVLLDRIREQREVAGKKGKKPAKRKKGVPAESAEPLATETPNISSCTLALLKAWGKAVPFPVLEAGLRLMLEPNLQQTIVKPRRGRKKAQAESVPLVHGMDQVYASLTSQRAIRLVGKQAYQLDEESETVQLLLDESLLPLAHHAIAAFETLMQRKKLDEEEAGIAISQMVSQPYAATTHV